jgi:hypothetical protein
MPYIKQEDRGHYDQDVNEVVEDLDERNWNVGDVNYVFTRILDAWFNKKRRYQTICEIEGTLNCVAKEFYRRRAVPYEEEKIVYNTDVFDNE